MIVVTVDWPSSLRDMWARDAAIRSYREGAAELRLTAEMLEAACTDRPCVEASAFRRLAGHAEAAAWLEEHNPTPPTEEVNR